MFARYDEIAKLLRSWAPTVAYNGTVPKIYLFGSLVQESGTLFDPSSSDVDLITLVSDNIPIEQRVSFWDSILDAMHPLEQKLSVVLKRDNASAPTVSNVILTRTEAEYSIHKSGDRKLLSFRRFVDLSENGNELVALSDGGDEAEFIAENSDQLSIIRLCQDKRNRYVSTSVNRTRLFSAFDGLDPIPKDVMRLAAILAWNRGIVSDAKREDLLTGMAFMQTKIDGLPTDNPFCQRTCDRIAFRRSKWNRERPLDADMVMLLYELLFDEAVGQLHPSRRKVIDKVISDLGGRRKK